MGFLGLTFRVWGFGFRALGLGFGVTFHSDLPIILYHQIRLHGFRFSFRDPGKLCQEDPRVRVWSIGFADG